MTLCTIRNAIATWWARAGLIEALSGPTGRQPAYVRSIRGMWATAAWATGRRTA